MVETKASVGESKSDLSPHNSRRTKQRTISARILMIRKTVYLEASARTQNLIDAQRALRAAGWAIGSTWHDEATSPVSESETDWITGRLEELNKCDALIVLCGGKHNTPLQVPLLAGYALTRGLQLIWIGSSVRVASDHRNLVQFDTVEEFCDSVRLKRAA
jgi:hypothetical protein